MHTWYWSLKKIVQLESKAIIVAGAFLDRVKVRVSAWQVWVRSFYICVMMCLEKK
jgi:hypothetical protein